MLSVMKDVPLWMRENQIEKLKSVEDGEFFDLVCSEVHQLIKFIVVNYSKRSTGHSVDANATHFR